METYPFYIELGPERDCISEVLTSVNTYVKTSGEGNFLDYVCQFTSPSELVEDARARADWAGYRGCYAVFTDPIDMVGDAFQFRFVGNHDYLFAVQIMQDFSHLEELASTEAVGGFVARAAVFRRLRSNNIYYGGYSCDIT
jgi:hypothetical protein